MLVTHDQGLDESLQHANELRRQVETLEEAFAGGDRSTGTLRELLGAKEQLEALEAKFAAELNRAIAVAEQLALLLRGGEPRGLHAGRQMDVVDAEVFRLAEVTGLTFGDDAKKADKAYSDSKLDGEYSCRSLPSDAPGEGSDSPPAPANEGEGWCERFDCVERAWLAGWKVGSEHDRSAFLANVSLARRGQPNLRDDDVLMRELGAIRSRVGAEFN